MDFYRKQLRIALRNCGFIDPENIEEYIAREGYFALADCLLNKQPTDVIDIIKRSGLRGRGGGGFPTGLPTRNSQMSNTWFVTPTKEIPVHSWTVPLWRATHIRL